MYPYLQGYMRFVSLLFPLIRPRKVIHLYMYDFVYLLVIAISFDQSTYTVNENGGPLKPVLVLSNSSTFDITVHIMNNDNTATGK